MKKDETIERYGREFYLKNIADSKEWVSRNPERQRNTLARWRANNPQKVLEVNRQKGRRGGIYYEQAHTGIPGARNKIRNKHGKKWRPYKQIIAPGSQLHHQWIPETANYSGLALVEADQHTHGFIDVIKILEGEITLFTEKEIREQGKSDSAF